MNNTKQDRIAHLRIMHRQWALDLESVDPADHEMRGHFAQALEDLQTLIHRLESEVEDNLAAFASLQV